MHEKLALTIPMEHIEREAQQQIHNVLKLPELVRLAVMPDVHAGYDLCIGGVALMRGVVSPSFVGYDIGCGMTHLPLSTDATPDLVHELRAAASAVYQALLEAIPAGVGGGHGARVRTPDFISASGDGRLTDTVNEKQGFQLGTLGSGNHFLEVGVNAEEKAAITIHSGSRGPGHAIGSFYMRRGRYFPLDSPDGRAYLADMNWALGYALENRTRMLAAAVNAVRSCGIDVDARVARNIGRGAFINENHNHAEVRSDGTVLHRKGATPAALGQLGVIPANQRDGVWITRGLGNEAFLCSASHGAGRLMSRKAAKAGGSVRDLAELMQGIVARTDAGVLDEAPWAYKPIDEVLRAQDGVLVDVIDHFKPLVVVKG